MMDFSMAYQMVNNVIIPFNIGLFALFSLSFVFLQIVITLSRISTDSNKGKINNYHNIWPKLWLDSGQNLINDLESIWKWALGSIVAIFIFYWIETILSLLGAEQSQEIVMFIFFPIIIMINMVIIILAIKLPFSKVASQIIRESAKSSLNRQYSREEMKSYHRLVDEAEESYNKVKEIENRLRNL